MSTDETMSAAGAATLAAARLVDRSGGSGFEIGYTGDDDQPDWYATATFGATRISVDGHADPEAASVALALRLLRGATCRCGRAVSIYSEDAQHCQWRLQQQAWRPGCDAPPMPVDGGRGDVAALSRAGRRARARRIGNPPGGAS